jgi:recombinational DNA repair protein RecT
MRIAVDNRQSVINAVTNIAAIGISLNPARKQAYLVPRDGKICLDISYMGLLDLAIQSGSIRWGQAELVYPADEFTMNGVGSPPTHKRQPFAKDRGEFIGAYVVVKTVDGDFLTMAMSVEEIHAVRDRSSAWKAWVEKKKKCPWVTDEGEMAKKTVIKRAYKTWPKTERMDRLENAVHYLNTEAGEGLHEEAPKTDWGIKPTAGALQNVTTDELEKVRECAAKVRKGYDSLGAVAAARYIDEQGFSSDEQVALWELFKDSSEMRSGIQAAQRMLHLSDEKKAQLDEAALVMIEAFAGGNGLAALEVWNDVWKQKPDGMYLESILSKELALMEFIEAQK